MYDRPEENEHNRAMEWDEVRKLSEAGPSCHDLGGIDCSGNLQGWAGPENCVVLAETKGTCKAYCEARNRRCIKAVDDVPLLTCEPQKAGFSRQTMEEDGCLQDWRTQICACSPVVAATFSAYTCKTSGWVKRRGADEMEDPSEARCCEATCSAYTCQNLGWLKKSNIDKELHPSEEKCCEATCSAHRCTTAGWVKKSDAHNKVNPSESRCCESESSHAQSEVLRKQLAARMNVVHGQRRNKEILQAVKENCVEGLELAMPPRNVGRESYDSADFSASLAENPEDSAVAALWKEVLDIEEIIKEQADHQNQLLAEAAESCPVSLTWNLVDDAAAIKALNEIAAEVKEIRKRYERIAEEQIQRFQEPPIEDYKILEMSPCYWQHAKYVGDDLIRIYGRKYEPFKMRDVLSCQHRCLMAAGCAHFTFKPDGECSLHDYDAKMEVAPHAIAGPSDCNDAKELEAMGKPWMDPRPPEAIPQQAGVFRMADPEGDTGVHSGSTNMRGLPHGRGMLKYDQAECTFVGEFVDGRMWQGVVYDTSGPRAAVKDTMQRGSWHKNAIHQEIVARFPFPGQEPIAEEPSLADVMSGRGSQRQPVPSSSWSAQTPPIASDLHRQAAPSDIHLSASSDIHRRTAALDIHRSAVASDIQSSPQLHETVDSVTTGEPFMREGSIFTVVFVVTVFAGLAVSGVLERKI